MSAIQQAINHLTSGEPLENDLALRVAGEILAGEATPAQIGAFLTGLRIRGEQPGHLLAFARTMRTHAAPIEISDRDTIVDTCGTGGDHSGTFNISTAAAIIAAGAGARIAKHGNRAVTGRCGSADVLKALGVQIEMPPEKAAQCLDTAGLTFFFAPVFHASMRHAAAPRREIGIRTIFNMLGPLANPGGAKRQLIGVYDRRLMRTFAEVLLELGSEHVMIVHGSDGLDEITLTGATEVMESSQGKINSYSITPEEFGLARAPIEALLGGTAEENAATIRRILEGERGPKRDVAVLNAAAALVVGDRAESIDEGIESASRALDGGAAREALEKLVAASNEAVVI
jgi:anthranilate phosphoribosyltransferase